MRDQHSGQDRLADIATHTLHTADAAQELWDAIVIGTGVGGATAGYALAKRGFRVLFLEKGRMLHASLNRDAVDPALFFDDRPEARLARGWWPYPLEGRTTFGRQRFFAPVGCGSGGSSTLYAAQLERLRPEDFRPRQHHPAATGSSLPDAWPIEYDELVPYYEMAEELYRVRGTSDPLSPETKTSRGLFEPPAMSDRDQRLFESFKAAGLHPYRAHVGCDFVEGCTGCGGVLCARGCKSDSAHICLRPAMRDFGAKLLPECEVRELQADRESVRYVGCRVAGQDLTLRSRVVLLGAGAFASPALLLKSTSRAWPTGLANTSDQVGRNLMVHAHVWFAVGSDRLASPEGPLKSISLNDFYVHSAGKLGTLQSLGISMTRDTVAYYLDNQISALPPAIVRLLRPLTHPLSYVLSQPFKNAATFAGIIEDLPYRENRVMVDVSNPSEFRFEYTYPDELRARCDAFTALVRKALGARHRVLVISGKNNLDFGHVCGTVRFGNDPATSVLDASNRAHGVNNLYVVDASFFPSSGGTNLSLTIAANALRVADILAGRLDGERSL